MGTGAIPPASSSLFQCGLETQGGIFLGATPGSLSGALCCQRCLLYTPRETLSREKGRSLDVLNLACGHRQCNPRFSEGSARLCPKAPNGKRASCRRKGLGVEMQVKPLAGTKETESYPRMRLQPTEEQQEMTVGPKHQNSTQRHSQEESWLHSLQAAVNLLHKRHHPKRDSAEEQGDVCIMYAPLGLCVFLGERREECTFVAAPSDLCFKSHANEFHRSRGAIARGRRGWQSPKLDTLPSALASHMGLMV